MDERSIERDCIGDLGVSLLHAFVPNQCRRRQTVAIKVPLIPEARTEGGR